ncbi:MAG: aspartate aminotransferase family protein [Candidatus Hydrogenedentota bacterium]|nr:MAG: aspartate aminotransferase family protein [Candidatus Hydrogenedentota bacterium]
MNTQEIQTLANQYVINTYGTRKLALVRGEGKYVWDAEGRRYLDFLAGISVVNLGHCHPKVTEAICNQAQQILHTSNLYYIESQVKLAELLSQHCFADKWFFSNSGAEANEAAIKIARRYWQQKEQPKPTIVTAHASFHGRTLTTISASGQPKLHDGFSPLMQGFKYADFNDLAALEKAITPDVGAILLEPVQGEGGVGIPDENYLTQVRQLCNDKNILMILDEIQTGLGRTGELFAHQHADITPDIMTLAKSLGNGVPIGAMGCTDEVSQGFSIGSHGSTFGGNPLCTAAALASVTALLDEKLVENAAGMGEYFKEELLTLADKHAIIKEVRGKGLMIGMDVTCTAAVIINAMFEKDIIVGPAGLHVVRFLPPLIIHKEDVDTVISALDDVLGAL